MADIEQEIRAVFTEEAVRMSHNGDTSWQSDVDQLVRLYDEREDHTHDFWLTAEGSPERAEWAQYNAVYITALRLWEETWAAVIGHHEKGKSVTYQVVSDYIKTKSMDFSE